jgi:hydroxymethylpyrimidine/phosphomethylpyrimidine kinase
LNDDAIETIRTALFRHATVVTANIPEAEVLSGRPIKSPADMESAARGLLALGAGAILIKGGHLEGPATDVLVSAQGTEVFSADRIETPHTHGTGCTLASAIAARLACGEELVAAISGAKRYVTWAIRHAPGLGHGHGPLGWGPDGVGDGT